MFTSKKKKKAKQKNVEKSHEDNFFLILVSTRIDSFPIIFVPDKGSTNKTKTKMKTNKTREKNIVISWTQVK